jgi:hypothetical protein
MRGARRSRNAPKKLPKKPPRGADLSLFGVSGAIAATGTRRLAGPACVQCGSPDPIHRETRGLSVRDPALCGNQNFPRGPEVRL